MSYKTIVVHVDDSRHANARIEAAATIAAQENAHLIGAATTGVSRFLYETLAVSPEDPGIAPYLHTLRERAKESLLKFECIAERLGVASFERRLVDDEAAEGFSQQARYCDLMVLSQYDRDDPCLTPNSDLPEYVVMNGGCPALIVPSSDIFNGAIERILIAWNGSVQAAHAVRGALPLLKRAMTVEVAIFHPASKPDSQMVPAAADIATYLARHDVKADVMLRTCNETATGDIGDLLLSLAAELSSNLLVMGCYGHSRFREVLLGGATRVMLEKTDIPVLMAH